MTRVSHQIDINVTARTSQAQAALRGVSTQVRGMGASVRNSTAGMNAAMASSTSRFRLFAETVRSDGLAWVFMGQIIQQNARKVREAMEENIASYAKFHKSMVEFAVIAEGTSQRATELQTRFFTLSEAFGQGANSLAVAAREVAAMGKSIEDSYRIVEVASRAAIAGLSDVGTTSLLFVTTMNQFRLGLSQLAHISDVFVQAANATNLQISDMATAMQYAGAAGAGVGYELEQVASILGILSNAGLEASKAGTNLRQALMKLRDPTAEGADLLFKFGIRLREDTDYSRGLRKELDDTSDVLESLRAIYDTNASSVANLDSEVKGLRRDLQDQKDALAEVEERLLRSNAAFKYHNMELQKAQGMYDLLQNKIDGVNSTIDAFSSSVSKNNIMIMKIRHSAARNGRELTKSELDSIARLEIANDGLRIQMEEQRLVANRLNRTRKDTANSIEKESDVLKNLSDDAMAKYEKKIDSLEDKLKERERLLEDNRENMDDQSEQLQVLQKEVSALSLQYQYSAGSMRSFADIVDEIERGTKDLSTAEKDHLVNTLLGIRGYNAYQLTIQMGTKSLRDLEQELLDSSDAFAGQGATMHISNEIMKNHKTQLDRNQVALENLKMEIAEEVTPAQIKFQRAVYGSAKAIIGKNDALKTAYGVLSLYGGGLLEIVGSLLTVIPLWTASRVLKSQNAVATTQAAAASAKNTVAISAETAALSAQNTALGANVAAKGAAGGASMFRGGGGAGKMIGGAGMAAPGMVAGGKMVAGGAAPGAAAGAAAGGVGWLALAAGIGAIIGQLYILYKVIDTGHTELSKLNKLQKENTLTVDEIGKSYDKMNQYGTTSFIKFDHLKKAMNSNHPIMKKMKFDINLTSKAFGSLGEKLGPLGNLFNEFGENIHLKGKILYKLGEITLNKTLKPALKGAETHIRSAGTAITKFFEPALNRMKVGVRHSSRALSMHFNKQLQNMGKYTDSAAKEIDKMNKELSKLYDALDDLSGHSVLKDFNADWVNFLSMRHNIVSSLGLINREMSDMNWNMGIATAMGGGSAMVRPIENGSNTSSVTSIDKSVSPTIHINSSPIDVKDPRMKAYLKEAVLEALRGG